MSAPIKLTAARTELLEVMIKAFFAGVMKKAVLSKPTDSEQIKVELAPMKLGESTVLRKIAYMRDGKAIQKNLPADDVEALSQLFSHYGQLNLLTTVGDAELRTSRSGKENLSGAGKIEAALRAGVNEEKLATFKPTTARRTIFFRVTRISSASLEYRIETAASTIKNSTNSARYAAFLNTLRIFTRICRERVGSLSTISAVVRVISPLPYIIISPS